ncbi:hypothetical protein ACE14D_18330 [Streptomyces sp. Act-28]
MRSAGLGRSGHGVDRTPPESPTGLSSYARAGFASVSWTAPGGRWAEDWNNGGHYRVYRSPGRTFDPAARTEVACAEEGSDEADDGGRCVDQDVPVNTYVTYAVTAVDPDGNESAYSAPVAVSTGDTVAPGPVAGVKATPRNDGVLVSWSASPEDDIDEYVAWTGVRQADGTVEWLDPDTCREGTSNWLAILCGDLPDGETYVYAVTAKDHWGNTLHPSDPKVTVVEATELDLRPSVTVARDWDLGGLSHNATATRPSVDWQCTDTDRCATVAGYRVSRWNPATEAYEHRHDGLLPADARSWVDTTATKGDTYFYTLEAVTADGAVVGTYPWCIVFQDRV